MTTTRLQVASDAMISAAFPSKNYGGLSRLSVNATPNIRRGFVFFNQPFPLGVSVLSATLHLFQKGASTGGSRIITVQRISEKWVESKLTSDNAPATAGGTATATFGNRADGSEWAFDVQAILQSVADGADWYGFRISSNLATAFDFYAREGGDQYAPVLEVTWSDAPSEPVGLSPSSNRAVSIARPTLRWDFIDPGGDSTQGGFQVQTNTVDGSWVSGGNFTDSGTVVSSVPEWLMTFDVGAGTTRFWRVRVQDDAGLWSDWSDSVSFTRTAKPTVVITAPADSPSNILYEQMPTFSWTVTGATQKSYQLFLVNPLDPSEIFWTSDKITGTTTSMTLPSSQRLLLTPGGSYRLVLRIRDTVSREGTPGDSAYTEVLKDFTFGTSGAVTGVSGLAATPDTASPFVTLQWTRSTAPDEFVIIEGGKTIAVLDPADVFVSGTTYRYVDRRSTPQSTHTWGVAARVGTATSNFATTTGSVTPEGVWLYELDGSRAICIGGYPDPVGMVVANASEDTAVHTPVGADNPVLITQSLRGPTGSVSGSIASSYLADWLNLAKKRGVTLGMTRVDLATKVQIFNTVRDHADEFGGEIPIRFEYVEIT